MFELYKQLNKWIDDVSEAVINSREWFLINALDLSYNVRNEMGLVLMRKYCYEHLDTLFKVKGKSVDTKELDILIEKLEVIASMGETKKELEEKGMASSSLMSLVDEFQLVNPEECPF